MDARDVHDHPGQPPGDEPACGLPCAQEGPGQVDREHTVPLLERHVDQGVGPLDSGIVDEDVDLAAELLAGPVEHRLDLSLVGDVGLDGERPSSVAAKIGHEPPRPARDPRCS